MSKSKSKHTLENVLKSLSFKQGISVNERKSTVTVSKDADLGIKSLGQIDYLVTALGFIELKTA